MRGRASPFVRAIPRRKSVFFGNIGERIRAFTPVPFRRMRRRLWGMRYRTRVSVPRSIACNGLSAGYAETGAARARKRIAGEMRRVAAALSLPGDMRPPPLGAWRMEWANLLEKQAPAAFIPVPGGGKTP